MKQGKEEENQGGESMTLSRMVQKVLSGKMALEWSPEGGKGKNIQAEGTTSAKALGLECAWSFQRLSSSPCVWSR